MATQNIAQKGIAGVVVSAGRMMKTVKVRMVRQEWNRHLRKNYAVPYNLLVNDPNNSLQEGDVILTTPERHSKHVLHTVSSIIAPFGKPVEERPPLFTQEQRESIYNEKRGAKRDRRRQRAEEASKIKEQLKMSRRQASPRLIDDGGEGGGKGPDGKGRLVLPQGLHKFHAINDEAREGKKRTLERQHKGLEHEKDKQKVQEKSDEEVQKEALGR